MGKHYDIVIAGGGMVGTAMACAVGRNAKLAAKSVLMLEAGPQRTLPSKAPQDPYSNRVVSLNAGTRQFLQSLGAWDHIAAQRFATVKKMQIWDSCSEAMITFEHPGLAEDVSYIVENDVVLGALGQSLGALRGQVDVHYDARVESIALPNSSGPANVTLHTGSAYTCGLVIGAEGFSSLTRRAMDSQWLSWNYGQSGVVATLRLAEPTANLVAWQRFLPTGPIALLPLTDELSSLVWTNTTKGASQLVKMSEEAFVDAVNDALWKQQPVQPVVESASRGLERLLDAMALPRSAPQQLPPSVRAVLPASRACFPLGFGHAARYAAPSAALIGDAAHRVHPLAGQGVNLGFGDAECLSNILADAAFSGERIGSMGHLAEYERRRQCHNVPTMAAIDALQKLYGTAAAPVVLLRSLGMFLTHSFPPLKRAIMNHASV